jgi:hypothetical protein
VLGTPGDKWKEKYTVLGEFEKLRKRIISFVVSVCLPFRMGRLGLTSGQIFIKGGI